MSDLTIFVVGLLTTILLGGGLAYTVREFHLATKSLERQEKEKLETSVGERAGVSAAHARS